MFFKTVFAAFFAAAAVQASPSAFSGDATWYEPDGNVGACGNPIQNTDLAVALSPTEFDGGAECGAQITVSFQGASVTATVEDLCEGCASGSIDLTPSAFEELAALDVGRIEVTWVFD